MYWLILIIAGLLEAGWVIGIQLSQNFTKPAFVLFAAGSMIISLILFTIAIRTIPASQAYLIWLAIGASAISVINHYFFNQVLTPIHLLCISLIFLGVIGLKLL